MRSNGGTPKPQGGERIFRHSAARSMLEAPRITNNILAMSYNDYPDISLSVIGDRLLLIGYLISAGVHPGG